MTRPSAPTVRIIITLGCTLTVWTVAIIEWRSWQ